ncbi:MAG: serine hydrolase [Acidobacteriota bacterium]
MLARTLLQCLFCTVLAATASWSSTLDREINALIEASGAEVAVALRTFDGRQELLVSEDLVLHAASTMKVPVMIELFRQAEAGELGLDDTMLVSTTFKSIVDGSPYELTADEDSDGQVYALLGTQASLRLLNEAMITKSSNLATNLLIEHLGAEKVRKTVTDLGGEGMLVLRGVEDIKAFEAGQSNRTTARALLVLMEAIARREAVSPAASKAMIDVLTRQQFRDGIPAGLPPNTRVAHKTGQITEIHHDAAIVLAERPYVLVVLTRGLADGSESAQLIADIARVVHEATQP